ncbi:MAG TPA: DNA polymerase III subunit gamma/tau [Candidatus Jorgensenbacteria bacterium]|uniref:DNA-directed DNA polymerase n=1 Tax=marine sediment metagenome TaxID=412755 RepID=A0A0F9K982_9ZZZZ|nr:DNA polymerase III subunit gamma/tau [Candidatus Jorgensenbacteria bacterium]
MALALYRKYRPSTFSDILGQDLIVRILQEAVRQDKIAHAYLFSGPRGTGKTTTARLIAKVANCLTRQKDAVFSKKGEPCNKCSVCQEISDGRNLNVIEIDAASNRGIDEIRSLKENIRVSPSNTRYKVFIIDEVHMMTKDAFNALLKTLEEPPKYIILILATTEIEKIPVTILSRTQQFQFKRVSLQQLIIKLRSIVKKEKMKISSEALELIAAAAEGSFRDAESLLDQLTAGGDKDITIDEVEEMVGKIGFSALSEFSGYLLTSDIDKALKHIAEVNDKGYNLVQFTKDVIQYLRRTAVLSFSPSMKKEFEKELINEHLKKLSDHAKLFTEKHLELLRALITAYSQMRYSQFPIIPLEVAIIESLKD